MAMFTGVSPWFDWQTPEKNIWMSVFHWWMLFTFSIHLFDSLTAQCHFKTEKTRTLLWIFGVLNQQAFVITNSYLFWYEGVISKISTAIFQYTYTLASHIGRKYHLHICLLHVRLHPVAYKLRFTFWQEPEKQLLYLASRFQSVC